jgi:hypothetical protein
MTQFTTHIIGDKEYQTDGGILLSKEVEDYVVKRANSIERLVQKTFGEAHDEQPITISIEYFRRILDHFDGQSRISIFIEKNRTGRSPVIFVADKKFVVVMPLAHGDFSLPVIEPTNEKVDSLKEVEKKQEPEDDGKEG